MAVIRNNNATALQVGGVVIPGRGEAEVPNWDAVVSRSRVIQAWVRVGILSAQNAPEPAPVAAIEQQKAEEPEESASDDATERAELFAALADLGIKAGGRTGTDKLRAMLAEARAANADSNTEG